MSWIELVAQRRPPTAPQGMQPPENAKEWFRIENSADDVDTTDVYVYDSIGGWFGMWADEFIEAIGEIKTPKMSIRLNSPGGSVFEGIAIANAIRNHPATVTVYVDSLAASIASVIAMAGDRLVMMPQSQIMVHNASGGCYGDAAEMTKMADLLDKQSLNIAQAYAEHTGRPLAEWQQYMADETWFTAEEALAVGLADEVMPMRPKKGEDAEEPASAMANMKRSWDLSMYHFAGRENAPAPKITEPASTPVAGSVITADVLSSAVLSDTFRDTFMSLVREAVRAELSVIEGTACPSHATAVKDGTWDAGANEGHLPSPVPLATVKEMYAYYDEDAVEDGSVPKSACKLPHHFVSSDGTPGAASVAGVRNALARLPQTKGLTDAERSAAEAHLRKHLDAFSGGDDEDHVHEELEAHEHEHVHDAQTKPAPQPEAEPEPEEDEPDGDDDDGASDQTTRASADDWTDVVAHLTAASPSADDVFNSLKEAW
jgi:ATP-dependent Clp endopeptidase proteolytic subunit ClpP